MCDWPSRVCSVQPMMLESMTVRDMGGMGLLLLHDSGRMTVVD